MLRPESKRLKIAAKDYDISSEMTISCMSKRKEYEVLSSENVELLTYNVPLLDIPIEECPKEENIIIPIIENSSIDNVEMKDNTFTQVENPAQEQSFLTPANKTEMSVSDSSIEKQIESNFNSFSNRKNSELQDNVEPLEHIKNDHIIVSQNTVQKQAEFLTNLYNAIKESSNNCVGNSIVNSSTIITNNQTLCQSILSQNEEMNYSMHPNYTQETDYQKIISCNQSNVKSDIREEIHINNPEIVNCNSSHHHDFQVEKQKMLINLDDDECILASSQIDKDEEKNKLEEEKGDVCDELNLSQNISLHNNHHLNNFNTSKSRSRSKSQSRIKRYQSFVTEEYPDDLVEGSIRNFNQSFHGESIENSFKKRKSNNKDDF